MSFYNKYHQLRKNGHFRVKKVAIVSKKKPLLSSQTGVGKMKIKFIFKNTLYFNDFASFENWLK